jgi:hypothetical protein
MVKYLIMIYTNTEARRAWQAYSDADKKAGLDLYAALNADLVKSGEMIVSESLADPAEGKRVVVRDGQLSTTDGPFAEVKEHLAGFYLVDCDSMDRAIEHAARIPEAAAAGFVEVRPVLTYQM